MKKRLILFIVILVLFGMVSCNSSKDKSTDSTENDSSEKIYDFRVFGVFRGIIPCADCPGIRTEIELKEGNVYEMRNQYIERSDSIYETTGNFKFGSDSIFTLSETGQEYSFCDAKLFHLDNKGERIDGVLAEKYVLAKNSFPLKNTKWELVELMGAAVSPNEETKSPYIMLKASENTIQGFAGCNGLGGNYQLNTETLRLSFSQLITTMMACPELETEIAFKQVLEKVDNYTKQDNKLMIYKGKTATLAKFKAAFFE